MQDIPSSLQRQARYYMHRDMLVKIRLLAGAPVQLIDNLMRRVSRVRLQAGHCAALEPQTAIFMEKGSMEFEPEGVLLSEGDCWMPRQQQSSELPGPPAVADPKGCRGLSTEVCYSFARIHEVEAVLKVRTLRAPFLPSTPRSITPSFDQAGVMLLLRCCGRHCTMLTRCLVVRRSTKHSAPASTCGGATCATAASRSREPARPPISSPAW